MYLRSNVTDKPIILNYFEEPERSKDPFHNTATVEICLENLTTLYEKVRNLKISEKFID